MRAFLHCLIKCFPAIRIQLHWKILRRPCFQLAKKGFAAIERVQMSRPPSCEALQRKNCDQQKKKAYSSQVYKLLQRMNGCRRYKHVLTNCATHERRHSGLTKAGKVFAHDHCGQKTLFMITCGGNYEISENFCELYAPNVYERSARRKW